MAELQKICLDDFQGSVRRPAIMAGLTSIHTRLIGLKITGEMWVDGSFTTKKAEPEDVDIVVYAPPEFFDKGTAEQQDFLNWLSDDRDTVRSLFSCHTAAYAVYPAAHVLYPLYQATRLDYQDKFGHSVTTREDKGICVVPLFVAMAHGEGGA